MSSAATHLQKLDKVERRVLRLLDHDHSQRSPQLMTPLNTLEHSWDVAALVVFFKAQVEEEPYLARLKLPLREAVRHRRTLLSSQEQVGVPRSRASQHQRTFFSRVSRLWNMFTSVIPAVQVCPANN